MRALLAVLCFFVILLSAGAFGAGLVVPEQLPSGVSWSFSVSLDASNSFTKTVITIDGVEIVNAFANSQVSIDPFNGGQVIKAFIVDTDPNSTGGMVLFVSHIGLNAGSHSVKATVLNNNQELGIVEKNVSVVDVLEKSFEQEVKDKLDSMNAKLGSLETNTNNKIVESMERLRKEISEARQESREEMSSLKETYNEGLAKIGSQIRIAEQLEQEIAGLKRENEEPQSTPQQLPSTGLANLALPKNIQDIALPTIGVIAIAALIVLLVKKRPFFGKNVSLPDFETVYEQMPVPKDVSEENQGEILKLTSTGKWAHGKEEK